MTPYSVNFCGNLFGEIQPDDVLAVQNKMVGETTKQAEEVMKMLDARKVINQEHSNGLRMFGADPVNGFVVELESGKLGLVKA